MDELRGTRTSGMVRRAAEVLRRSDMEGWTRAAPDLYPHQWELGHRLYSRRARAPRYQLLARAGLAGSVVTPLEVNPRGVGEQGRAEALRRGALDQLSAGGFTEYFEPFIGEPLG